MKYAAQSVVVCLLASGLVQAGGGPFQKPREQAPQVEYNSSRITLRITQNTTLEGVLETFCRSSGTVCEGTQQAQEIMVIPVVISGVWSEVTFKLLDGTKLNFVASPPAGHKPGKLIISKQNGSIEPLRYVQESPSSTSLGQSVIPAASEPPASDANRSTPNENADIVPVSSAPSRLQTGIPSQRSAGVGSREAPTFSPAPATGAVSIGSPFADGFGQTTPPQGGTALFMPFVDAFGNPIPIIPKAPGQQEGSPFPETTSPDPKE